MTTETLMTDAANTNEGSASSQAAPAATEGTTPAAEGAATQHATEGQTQTDAPKGEGEGKTDGEQAAPAGAPEKYEFKAPEGQAFDNTVVEQFSEVAKELNLPQDAAQKILDKMAPAIQARQDEALQAVRTEWEATSKADKEFGGDKLAENLAVAKRAMDQFGTPELRELLNTTGLGNHPEIIRTFYRAGLAISEDGFVSGNGSKVVAETPAQRMYPNMNP